jgi:hypothetical protein
MTAPATKLPISTLTDPGGGGFRFRFRQVMGGCPIASHMGSGGSEVSTVRGLVGLVRLWFGFAHRCELQTRLRLSAAGVQSKSLGQSHFV